MDNQLPSPKISATNYVKCYVINQAAGRNYGSNKYEVYDPRTVKVLSQIIGNLGVDTNKYAIYKDYNFRVALEDRKAKVKNKTSYIIIHKSLLDLVPLHRIERWVTPKVLFDHK